MDFLSKIYIFLHKVIFQLAFKYFRNWHKSKQFSWQSKGSINQCWASKLNQSCFPDECDLMFVSSGQNSDWSFEPREMHVRATDVSKKQAWMFRIRIICLTSGFTHLLCYKGCTNHTQKILGLLVLLYELILERPCQFVQILSHQIIWGRICQKFTAYFVKGP